MDKISKALNRIQGKNRIVVKLALIKLDARNFSGLDIKKLIGYENVYRVRVGRYRIIFEVNPNKLTILNIASRSEKWDICYNGVKNEPRRLQMDERQLDDSVITKGVVVSDDHDWSLNIAEYYYETNRQNDAHWIVDELFDQLGEKMAIGFLSDAIRQTYEDFAFGYLGIRYQRQLFDDICRPTKDELKHPPSAERVATSAILYRLPGLRYKSPRVGPMGHC